MCRAGAGSSALFGLTAALDEVVLLHAVATPYTLDIDLGCAAVLVGVSVLTGIPAAWGVSRLDRADGRWICAASVLLTMVLAHAVAASWTQASVGRPGQALLVSLPGLLVADVVGACALTAILAL